MICSMCFTLRAQTSISGEVDASTINSGKYKLTGDVTIMKEIYASGELEIDLNGHVLERVKNGDTDVKRFLITLHDGAKVTIIDSNPSNSNKITTESGGAITGGVMTGGKGDRGGAIYVSPNAKLYLNGGTIYKCIARRTSGDNHDPIHVYTDGGGGGVYLTRAGYFEMNGGAIIGCETSLKTIESVEGVNSSGEKYKYETITGCGGAVFIFAGAKFVMNGGTIKNNHAGRGGGVYVHEPTNDANSDYGVFEMNGGTIDENYIETTWNSGGGVYTCGKFVMKGGKIINNRPKKLTEEMINGYPEAYFTYIDAVQDILIPHPQMFGGGVYVFGKTGYFEMTGGEISRNAASSGGGVMVWEQAKFVMNGANAVLRDNYALGDGGIGNGGAVYLNHNSIFEFTSGIIEDNKARRYGGAVNLNESSEFIINGNCIVRNNQASHGGGISQEAGKCIMTLDNAGIEITGNKAHGKNIANPEFNIKNIGNGGGIFIEKGEFTINNATITDNEATGNGGGVSLRVERICGDMTVNINGGTIKGNKAGRSGGGLDLYANKLFDPNNDDNGGGNGPNGLNDVVVNLNNGLFESNISNKGGGAINIGINEENSTALMNIGTNDAIPQILSNKAIRVVDDEIVNGGAICMSNGTININNGNFKGNEVSNNGGAVYLGSGTVNIVKCTFNENEAGNMGGGVHLDGGELSITEVADIHNNSAERGGGISVNNGKVTIEKGNIFKNTAKSYGGGLFIYNKDENVGAVKDIVFSGGTFVQNTATLGGGGMGAIGNVNVTMNNAIIEDNVAYNGGGVYLGCTSREATIGAKMHFGTGLIRNNYAKKKDSTTKYETAYQGYSESLSGIGGGIFMGNNTTLTFDSGEGIDFGLYNNRADNGADDVFANGNNTSVTLPVVKLMNLKEFNGPTSRLYWVEDYLTGDTHYGNGTKMMGNSYMTEDILRYQYALKNNRPTYSLEFDTPTTYNSTSDNGYLCLAVGYELVYLKLVKKGLLNNDDVALKIYYESNGEEKHYTDVFFTGKEGDVDVSRTVALPAGSCKFKETNWGWRYNLQPTFSPAHATENVTIGDITIPSGYLDVSYDKENKKPKITNGNVTDDKLTITNTVKTGYEKGKVLEHSHRKVNRINPNSRIAPSE